MHADPLAIPDQARGVLNSHDRRHAVLACDNRAVGHQAPDLRHQAFDREQEGCPAGIGAQRLLFAIINGFTFDETTELGVEIEGRPDEQAADAVRAYIAELPTERFPNLIAVAEHFHYADDDQSFELLIDVFVDGLAARASRG
jgi:hypothetical protein